MCIRDRHKSAIHKVVELQEALCPACEEETKFRSNLKAKIALVSNLEMQVDKKKQAFAKLEETLTLPLKEVEKLKECE